MSNINHDAAKLYAERRAGPTFVYIDEGNLARAYLDLAEQLESANANTDEMKLILLSVCLFCCAIVSWYLALLNPEKGPLPFPNMAWVSVAAAFLLAAIFTLGGLLI